jgi:salicylate hydroxylase
MAECRKLHVGIIGAGIAGLAAAIGLSRAGHDVELFERSSFKNEVGAAIALSPNASPVLERWGFDFVTAGATTLEQLRCIKRNALEVVGQDRLDHVRAKYGYALNSFHRVDLHNELRRLAENVHAVRISLGCPVKRIDCHTGTLTLEDGRSIDVDLIVVADGIKVASS